LTLWSSQITKLLIRGEYRPRYLSRTPITVASIHFSILLVTTHNLWPWAMMSLCLQAQRPHLLYFWLSILEPCLQCLCGVTWGPPPQTTSLREPEPYCSGNSDGPPRGFHIASSVKAQPPGTHLGDTTPRLGFRIILFLGQTIFKKK